MNQYFLELNYTRNILVRILDNLSEQTSIKDTNIVIRRTLETMDILESNNDRITYRSVLRRVKEEKVFYENTSGSTKNILGLNKKESKQPSDMIGGRRKAQINENVYEKI